MLHDIRLFHSSLHYIWKRIVNVVFLKYHRTMIHTAKNKPWFDVLTVPFPNPIKGVFISRRVDTWSGKFHYKRDLFADKTGDLNGEVLNVVYFEHLPSVVVRKFNGTNEVGGVEIEVSQPKILNKTFCSKTKFKSHFALKNCTICLSI